MRKYVWIVVFIVLGIYFLTGVYQVGPSEVTLLKTFGRFTSVVPSGIHYHLPYPIQSHVTVDVTTVRKIEIGFRSIQRGERISYQSVPQEAIMITGDNNLVSVEAVVQYRVKDPVAYAFNITEADSIVRFTTESVLREKVAMRSIDDVLTSGRDEIGFETARMLQEILDSYNCGIKVENVYLQEVVPPDPVVDAFDDVNNARQDKERLINEARKYANDVVPKAQGQAQEILRQAEAYAQEVYLKALGEAKRFEEVLEEYSKAPDITRKRMLLDALQSLLEKSENKVFFVGNGDSLNILNISDLLKGMGK
ncbi:MULTISPECIES: FtsH protease activity modulator HflK [Thermotoga]|uniref:FtsH protease activity modulator HflK n=1 Tax=Thermotoga TaxID=2335 RepID=UPI000540BF77|nr:MULTISPECIES: FtsH protease activity modulator HflK [unclassified Thermotoga]AIY88318.1 HflK protein [Thermotoga sp. Cell2]AJG40850.1 cell division protein FtsH [Thermotoga sp. RQ7]KHC92259.1 HflK protein [Thermotoga sp. Mc24]KHC95487.1 HflK protein [Thermotoga sp. TBGT1765]KHC95800.1 HflK protein [Thermotoga sp. TBGT1766]